MREWLTLIFMVRADRRSWVPAAFWASTAVVSVTLATVFAAQPERLRDLHEVRSWLSFVQTQDGDPYRHFAGKLDYPPIGLLVLLPLSLIPDATLVHWFVPLNLTVTVFAGWVLARAIAERLNTRIALQEQVALVAMLLSSSGVRTSIWLGQTVSLSILGGALALLWSRRRPYAAAVALAICSYKPHLALGFGLAILVIDGVRVPLLAITIVTVVSLLAAAAVDQPAIDLWVNYVHNLVALYDGPDRVRGLLSIRWTIEELVGRYRLATNLYVCMAILTLATIGAQVRRAASATERTQIIAVILLWPLLFLPSQLYNSVMAAPALWLLRWPEGGLIRREAIRLAAVAAFTLIGVLDVPRLIRFATEPHAGLDWLWAGSYFIPPLRIALLFMFILFVLMSRRSTRMVGTSS